MLFALLCTDKPDGLSTRMANRPAHLDWLKAKGAAVKIAGPFTDDAGSPVGSLVVIEAADRAAAAAFAAEDPYAKAGLFAHVEIKPWKWVVGAPEGL